MSRNYFSRREPRPSPRSSHDWVGGFAACLMEIEPRISQARAVRVAVAAYARDGDGDPQDAARRFARNLVKPAPDQIVQSPPPTTANGASARYKQRFGE